jgi:uncharacterized membrane protein
MSTTTPSPAFKSARSLGVSLAKGSGRILSLDIVRGLVMVIMALDHTRDFFTNLRFEPETLSQTYYALFFTRWITHFCAPLFFFLAGTGAFLYGTRRSVSEVSRFLWTRGLWLVFLEFTVVGVGWRFEFPGGFFGVIWALGACMILMALVVWLPLRWIAGLSLLMIATHDLFDPIRPRQFGSYAWVWTILHVRGGVLLPFGIRSFVLFQIVPWFGVMGAGYAFGQLYLLDQERRKKLLIRLGVAAIALFIFLRVTNLYGNPPVGMGGVSQGDWHIQPTIEKTIILFFDVEKYPPSLQFLLMTLGPSFLLLAWLENVRPSAWSSILLVFGRVPMFFYILHLYVIHTLAIVMAMLTHQPWSFLFHGGFFAEPDDYGHGLPFVYLMWLLVIVILYFPCRWFAALKERRRDWWLSYL